MASCVKAYEPANVLKSIADDIWIVDGPIVRMKLPFAPFLSLPFSTRMTVVRLPGGKIWLHSPTLDDPALLKSLAALGEVAFLVAPNRLHHVWVGAWARHFPGARVYAAPKVAEAAGEDFPEDYTLLDQDPPQEWSEAFFQSLVPGGFLTEAVFFHRVSRTVIVTDLIENFEREKVCMPMWWLVKLAGAAAPNGRVPVDLRSTFRPHMIRVRPALRKILDWNAQRVILAHGAWHQDEGAERLRQAFDWALNEEL